MPGLSGKKFCAAFRQDLTEIARPGPTRRRRRRFTAFVLERGGKFLVRQRPASVVNAHCGNFPTRN